MFTTNDFIVSLMGEGLFDGKQLASTSQELVYHRQRGMRVLEGRNQILQTNAIKWDTSSWHIVSGSQMHSVRDTVLSQWDLNEDVMWGLSFSLGLPVPAIPSICSSSSVTGTIHP